MVEGKKSINFLRGILYLSPALILMAIFTLIGFSVMMILDVALG